MNRSEAESLLRQMLGPTAMFRDGQWEAIELTLSLLGRRSKGKRQTPRPPLASHPTRFDRNCPEKQLDRILAAA